uniref:Replication protein E1 n=1 Tax=Human papillomavirus TaxID=10566 RepID=A0A385PJA4_9PAPI|nr:MAG: E1 protein [Human papillomavirus]
MADPSKGTDSFDSLEGASWYFVNEAECTDDIDCFDELFEGSTDSNISNLLDDTDEVSQGNTLALFSEQLHEDCDQAIQYLKRKFVNSPEADVAALSPKLQGCSISPQKDKHSRRKLNFQDSGIEQDEVDNTLTPQVEPNTETVNIVASQQAAIGNEVLEVSNQKAYMLFKFKETFGVPYTELIRNYKSDKSCNNNWVIAVFRAAEEVLEASKIIIQKHCVFAEVIVRDFNALYIVEFKSAKNRDTVVKLFCAMLNVQSFQLLCDPPKSRSVAAALYCYKQSMVDKAFVYGAFPKWIATQTLFNHEAATAAETFELSKLVQWGYDNDVTDEAQMAYEYAQLAESDSNAAALLKHNNQVKFIRDACIMVKLYKRHEMRSMSMAEWIDVCCDKCVDDQGDWKPIMQLLKYQHVNILDFLYALKLFLKGQPKKNCLVFYGPPDSGKSYLTYSLVSFLKGRVVSYMNKNSQFWLQPLTESKIGLLDDATYPCWSFIDVHLRSALDGNFVCVDHKHRAPIQMKIPPLLVTTNHDVKNDQTLMYLHSRIYCVHFPNKMPLTDQGKPLYEINDCTWKCFFRKLANQLELTLPDKENGVAGRSFQCCSRSSPELN